ncbi:MAG: hypothetical protein E6J72_18150 [Deltaproteobacteria bacterium]|nr:MAG: hypothetical protein E6J72_18150 [Deltaproteobacteria bacterium]
MLAATYRRMQGTRVSRTTTILLYMLVGALVGAVTASFVVPPFLTWYNEPGAINAADDGVDAIASPLGRSPGLCVSAPHWLRAALNDATCPLSAASS